MRLRLEVQLARGVPVFSWVESLPGGAIRRHFVVMRHVSRETLNRPRREDVLARRSERKDRRRARMRLRKRRGWR